MARSEGFVYAQDNMKANDKITEILVPNDIKNKMLFSSKTKKLKSKTTNIVLFLCQFLDFFLDDLEEGLDCSATAFCEEAAFALVVWFDFALALTASFVTAPCEPLT